MTASIINFDFTGDDAIVQGATDPRRFIWQDSNRAPVDLTGYTAAFQIRAGVAGPLLATLSTANGGLVLGGNAGTIDLLFSPATSAWEFRRGMCGLELTAADGTVTRFQQGVFELNREVVR